MQSLESCYKDIAQEYLRWSYYGKDAPDINEKWKNNHDAYDFLKNYFDFGGKSKVFEDEYLTQHEKYIKDRSCHIISTYLLGIMIAEFFQIYTDKRDRNNMNFKYRWFLSCLYHDVGYAYENKFDCSRLTTVRDRGIDGFVNEFNLEYVDDIEFKPFIREEVDLYLRCRADCRKSKPVIDHGIAGGLMLYEKLRKQFEKAWMKRDNSKDSRQSFYVRHSTGNRTLHYSEDHFEEYAEAANTIIAHNIWISTLKDYITKYGNDRMLRDYTPIGLDNQICFILSIADTIEPLKRDFKYIDKVYIEGITGQKGFCISTDADTFSDLYCNIKKLEDWIEVSVEVTNDGSNKLIRIMV